MSRSFKKKPFSSCVRYSSDKWCKTTYHRNRRRKDKALCKECLKYSLTKCGGETLTPDEKFINENIDRSVSFANKYCWASDGGNYYFGGIEDCRKDFEEEVFGSCERYGVGYESPWEKYQNFIEEVFNKEKPKYTVKLSRLVRRKIDFGYYMPWDFVGEVGYTTETKYLTTETYPPKLKPEEYEGWKIENWWKQRTYFPSRSNWDLFGFLFKSGIIPLDFKNENELMDWLRANEEKIIEKWLKAKLLRK